MSFMSSPFLSGGMGAMGSVLSGLFGAKSAQQTDIYNQQVAQQQAAQNRAFQGAQNAADRTVNAYGNTQAQEMAGNVANQQILQNIIGVMRQSLLGR